MSKPDEAREAAWDEISIVPLLIEMTDKGEQIRDPRARSMQMVRIGFNRGYDAAESESRRRIEELTAILRDCKYAISTLPIKCFGYGEINDSAGHRRWPVRDELLDNIRNTLKEKNDGK